jgi:hypothetical protein
VYKLAISLNQDAATIDAQMTTLLTRFRKNRIVAFIPVEGLFGLRSIIDNIRRSVVFLSNKTIS